MDYKPTWDLSTIPAAEWNSENGRRQRAKGPPVTRENIQPCVSCGRNLNATQRRKPCPECSYVHPRSVSK